MSITYAQINNKGGPLATRVASSENVRTNTRTA